MKTGELITINDAARLKGVSRQAVHAAISSGKLKPQHVRVTVFRLTRAELNAWTPNPNMKRTGRKAMPQTQMGVKKQ